MPTRYCTYYLLILLLGGLYEVQLLVVQDALHSLYGDIIIIIRIRAVFRPTGAWCYSMLGCKASVIERMRCTALHCTVTVTVTSTATIPTSLCPYLPSSLSLVLPRSDPLPHYVQHSRCHFTSPNFRSCVCSVHCMFWISVSQSLEISMTALLSHAGARLASTRPVAQLNSPFGGGFHHVITLFAK